MPELWGGIECTVTRIGDDVYDQVERSGHTSRVTDIDLFAELGISRLRYPILFERIQPQPGVNPRWDTVDRHLDRMRQHEISAIAGLMHHGTGPRHASLVADDFPALFARYAGMVARRYPWIQDWTPINEPVTTARFCGLYGHWFPHAQSDEAFVRILIVQCEAIIRAMQAIREVRTDARYVHTEDVGRISSTPRLAYQAAFENYRQRVALDLLSGRLGTTHPLWTYLHRHGLSERQCDWFEQHAIIPDIICADYYRTSDRHLDHDLNRFDSRTHGGNHIHRYADVEAASLAGWRPDLTETLTELSRQYGSAVAVGEVHLAGTTQQQLRWALSLWCQAQQAEIAGTPVAAICFWALLGSYDWQSLMCTRLEQYEPGAFDISSGVPEPTDIARFIRRLARGQNTTLRWPGTEALIGAAVEDSLDDCVCETLRI